MPRLIENSDALELGTNSILPPIMLSFDVYFRFVVISIVADVGRDWFFILYSTISTIPARIQQLTDTFLFQ